MAGSFHHRRLCSIFMKETFGDDAEKVAIHLYCFGHRTLNQIKAFTRLNEAKVRVALIGLINYNIVSFSKTSPGASVLYYIKKDKVLFLQRYIRSVPVLKAKFGNEGELLLDTLVKLGQASASEIILQAASRLKNTQQAPNAESALLVMHEKLKAVIYEGFVCRVCSRLNSSEEMPSIEARDSNMFHLGELDMPALNAKLEVDDFDVTDQNDKSILWKIRPSRITLLLREEMLAEALTERSNVHAGNLVRVLLKLMSNTDPWMPTSLPIHKTHIAEEVRHLYGNTDLHVLLNDYIELLMEDSSRILKIGFADEYQVSMENVLEELSWAALERVVDEQFGQQGGRIFRVVRHKQYQDQDQIQNLAMLPAKDTKQLTYLLMDNNFLQVRELKLGAGGDAGKGPTSYLFFINFKQVVRMCLEKCYVALYSSMVRQENVTQRAKYLLAKRERVEALYTSVQGIEEKSPEYKEILEEMLTPMEQEELGNVLIWKERLLHGEYELDSSILLFELFLKVSQKVLDLADKLENKKR